MKKILDRLNEMPFNMLLRVANKFKLDVHIEESQSSIIKRLEESIADYLIEHDHRDDSRFDGVLSKYNLLDDIEVPHEIYKYKPYEYKKTQNFVSYIDMIVIDDNWCYVYWDISSLDYKKIQNSADFKNMELHFLYKTSGFDNQYTVYDEKEIIPISIEDIDRNFYQQYHYMYCCCLLVANYTTGKHLLSVSGEVFFPHTSPLWQRNKLEKESLQALILAQNLHPCSKDSHPTLNTQNIPPLSDEVIQQKGAV